MKHLNEIIDQNIDNYISIFYLNESLSLIGLYTDKEVVEDIKTKNERCHNQCGNKNTKIDEKICHNSCKLKLQGEKIKELKKINCNEKQDPYKCKIRINKEIQKLKNRIQKTNEVINKLKLKKRNIK